MHFLITALGSYGDVHPMVGLGAALVGRGHRVSLVTNPYFEEVVLEAGLEMLPIGTREEYLEISKHPDVWHPVRGPRLIMEQCCVKSLRPLYDLVTTHAVPGETIFCAHGLDAATRIAGEKLGIPVAGVNLAPSIFFSVYDSPRLTGTMLGPGVPQWLKRAQFWLADQVLDRWIGRSVNRLRKELGLPAVHRLFSQWWHTTDLVLGLFPDWFASAQPDWPANVVLAGFPLWDAVEDVTLADDVRAFLEAGDPPIVFAPGSANRAAHTFFSTAVEACNETGRRGILLTKYGEQLPSTLPPTVRHFGFTPLSRLLPHAAAFVHHGGIGSSAQALAAGIPQLIRPMAYDQFDNARLLLRLGVAEEVSVKQFQTQKVAATLENLLETPGISEQCGKLANQCNGPAALERACEAIEKRVARNE